MLAQSANVDAVKAAVKVAEANIAAQEAQVARLKVLTGFEEIRAPFDGVVTTRNTDVGDAVTADTNTGAPLLTLARDDVLRLAVNVPLYAADGVRDGLEAKAEVAQLPGKVFPRPGLALVDDPAPRLPHPGDAGRHPQPRPRPPGRPLHHPDAGDPAGLPRRDGAERRPDLRPERHPVAVVEAGQDGSRRVRMRPVTIFRQTGSTLELRTGLDGGEQVVVGPPASLRDGDAVALRAEGKAGT